MIVLTPLATCPECGQRVPLRGDGRLPSHLWPYGSGGQHALCVASGIQPRTVPSPLFSPGSDRAITPLEGASLPTLDSPPRADL
jgi:hypothetical protein